jgi:hypothetical protein
MVAILISKPWVGVKWTCWVIYFYGTIGRMPENYAESHQVYNNVLCIDSSWPLWTWWVIYLDGTMGRMSGNCAFDVTFVSRGIFVCPAMLVISSQSFMIIYWSPICVELMVTMLVIKPRVHFKWTWWVICLNGTIGQGPENCASDVTFVSRGIFVYPAMLAVLSQPSLYQSPICVEPMVLILVNTPQVFLKYIEQLAKCHLIQSNANNTNMTVIDAPLLSSDTNSNIMQYKINLKFNQKMYGTWAMVEF